MTVSKLQWAAGVLVACGALAAGGVWAGGQPPPDEQPVAVAAVQPAAGQPRPAAAQPAGEPPARVEQKATGAQRRISLNNLKQILLAVHNYHDVHNQFPGDVAGAGGKALLSWRVAILPYLDHDALYRQFKLTEPWDSEHNLKLLAKMPVPYRLPGDPAGATHTYYQVFVGPGTPLGRPRPGRFADVTDGTSNTLGVVEGGPAVPWTKPGGIPYDPKGPGSKVAWPFSNGFHAATLDGAAFALKRNIDPDVLRHLIEAADGNVVPRLNTLTAPLPAETPAEKASLKQQIARNQKQLAVVEQLLKEHVELLGTKIAATTDAGEAEGHAAMLERIIEELRQQNGEARGRREPPDAPPPPARPVPRPIRPTPPPE